MTKKHEIKSDEKLNPQLKEEVTTLRGGILSQAEKNELPSRFSVKSADNSPSMIITDNDTGKQVKVPLFAYGDVRKVLNKLFG